jgi:hypothetical protein
MTVLSALIRAENCNEMKVLLSYAQPVTPKQEQSLLTEHYYLCSEFLESTAMKGICVGLT